MVSFPCLLPCHVNLVSPSILVGVQGHGTNPRHAPVYLYLHNFSLDHLTFLFYSHANRFSERLRQSLRLGHF